VDGALKDLLFVNKQKISNITNISTSSNVVLNLIMVGNHLIIIKLNERVAIKELLSSLVIDKDCNNLLTSKSMLQESP